MGAFGPNYRSTLDCHNSLSHSNTGCKRMGQERKVENKRKEEMKNTSYKNCTLDVSFVAHFWHPLLPANIYTNSPFKHYLKRSLLLMGSSCFISLTAIIALLHIISSPYRQQWDSSATMKVQARFEQVKRANRGGH